MYLEVLLGTLSGIDVREGSHLTVIQGPREVFRRQLNYVAVTYIIAHELGHVLEPYGAATNSLDLSGMLQATSEQQVLASQKAELAADRAAYRILSAPPLCSDEPWAITPMAPMLVSALQVGVYEMNLAAGSRDYGWTHPAPLVRLGSAFNHLAIGSSPAVLALAGRFYGWLYDVFQVQRWREQVAELEKRTNRGSEKE